jgi:hypothetical protein
VYTVCHADTDTLRRAVCCVGFLLEAEGAAAW